MAEHGSSPSPPPPGTTQHDWELLSISMSSSALRNLPPPAPDPPLESASGSSLPPPPPAAWNDPFVAEDSQEKLPEPFTEGWRPHLQPPSSTYDAYASDNRAYPEESYPDESFVLNQDVKPVTFHSESYMIEAESIMSTGGVSAKENIIESEVVEFQQIVSKKGSRNRAWWKQPTTSKVVWSVAVATTILGIAALGRTLMVERHQNQQLRLELSVKEEKLNDLVYQVYRLRDVLGGQQKMA